MMTAEELEIAARVKHSQEGVAAVLDYAQNSDEVVERASEEYRHMVNFYGHGMALEIIVRAVYQNGVMAGWSEVQEDPQAFGLDGNPEA
jgi:RecB family exonuclease